LLGALAKRFGLLPLLQFGLKVEPGVEPGDLTPELLLSAIAGFYSVGVPRPQRYEEFVRKYGTVIWVYVAVSINMRNTAVVPIIIERQSLADPGEWIEAPQSDLAKLLARVNGLMTRYDLWEATSANLDLTGNIYWLLFPDAAGIPREIWPLRPDRVEIIPDPREGIWGYRYTVNARIFEFSKRWVIHLRDYSPWHDFYGQGALSPSWVEASTYELSSRYRAAFYANSGRPDGVLSTEQQLVRAQIEQMRELWQETHTGVDNAHRTAILHSGLKYQVVAATHKEAELVKDREMNRQDILSGFGVSLAAAGIEVGDVGRREEQIRNYRESTIVPRVIKIVETLNEFLVIPHFGPTLRIRADIKAFLKEDEQRRSQIDVQEVEAGIRTVNEVRADRGDPPVPWGDKPPSRGPSPADMAALAQGLSGGGDEDEDDPQPPRKALPPKPDDDDDDDEEGERSFRRWRPRRALVRANGNGRKPGAVFVHAVSAEFRAVIAEYAASQPTPAAVVPHETNGALLLSMRELRETLKVLSSRVQENESLRAGMDGRFDRVMAEIHRLEQAIANVPAPVVNLTVPEQEPPVVNVHLPSPAPLKLVRDGEGRLVGLTPNG